MLHETYVKMNEWMSDVPEHSRASCVQQPLTEAMGLVMQGS